MYESMLEISENYIYSKQIWIIANQIRMIAD